MWLALDRVLGWKYINKAIKGVQKQVADFIKFYAMSLKYHDILEPYKGARLIFNWEEDLAGATKASLELLLRSSKRFSKFGLVSP